MGEKDTGVRYRARTRRGGRKGGEEGGRGRKRDDGAAASRGGWERGCDEYNSILWCISKDMEALLSRTEYTFNRMSKRTHVRLSLTLSPLFSKFIAILASDIDQLAHIRSHENVFSRRIHGDRESRRHRRALDTFLPTPLRDAARPPKMSRHLPERPSCPHPDIHPVAI